jgi:rhodanese-related sulfurtransferase
MHLLTALSFSAPLLADPGNPQIDYQGFAGLTIELAAERAERRIDEDRFLQMAGEEGTVILDTRGKAKFERRHVKGAIHLNFSDFTEEALAKLIPDKTTRILIYCNNNFDGAPVSMAAKSAPLALNIPTFINLRGYGYRNVYELKPFLDVRRTKIPFEGTEVLNEGAD